MQHLNLDGTVGLYFHCQKRHPFNPAYFKNGFPDRQSIKNQLPIYLTTIMDKKNITQDPLKNTADPFAFEMEDAPQDYVLARTTYTTAVTAAREAGTAHIQACAHFNQLTIEFSELQSKAIQAEEDYVSHDLSLFKTIAAGRAMTRLKKKEQLKDYKEELAQKIKVGILKELSTHKYKEKFEAMTAAAGSAITEDMVNRHVDREAVVNLSMAAAREAGRQSLASTNILSEATMEMLDAFMASFLYDAANDQQYLPRSLVELSTEQALTNAYVDPAIDEINANIISIFELRAISQSMELALTEARSQLRVAGDTVSATLTAMRNANHAMADAKEALEKAEATLTTASGTAELRDGELYWEFQDGMQAQDSAPSPMNTAGNSMNNFMGTADVATTTTTATTGDGEVISEESSSDNHTVTTGHSSITVQVQDHGWQDYFGTTGVAISAGVAAAIYFMVFPEDADSILEIFGSKSYDFLEYLP